MPSVRTLRINNQSLGLVESTAYQRQPAGGIVDSRDFWPVDSKTNRARLSTRPGFADFGSSLAGVNLIASLDVAADENNESPPTYKRQLMIARDGELYKNTGVGSTFTQVGANNIIDTGRNVQAASLNNSLYIANITNEYKVYRFMDDTVAGWTGSSGPDGPAAPQDCPLIAAWNGRLVLAGRDKAPHVVHFSRKDNPDDWNYAAPNAPNGTPDTGRAIAVPGIGEPVTALLVHNRMCLLAGTLTSTWIFSGDPGVGNLRPLSPVVGPINATAWCKDPNDVVYILTRRGLYRMASECGAPPEPISEHVIPSSLVGLDGVNELAYLEYDTRFRMLHIYIQASSPQYFHYFIDSGSFWEVTAPGTTIRAIGRYDLLDTSTASGVLIGTSTQLKRLDSGTAIGGSDAAYARILLNNGALGQKWINKRSILKFGANTTDTTGTVTTYGAKDAETVVGLPAARKHSSTIGTIMNNNGVFNPQVGGQSHLVAIAQTDTTKYISLEEGALEMTSTGRERGT